MDWNKLSAISTAVAVVVALAVFVYDMKRGWKQDDRDKEAEARRRAISQYQQALMIFPLLVRGVEVSQQSADRAGEKDEYYVSHQELQRDWGFPGEKRMEEVLKTPMDFPPELAMRMLRTMSYGYQTNVAIEECWVEDPAKPGWGTLRFSSHPRVKGLISALPDAIQQIKEQIGPIAMSPNPPTD